MAALVFIVIFHEMTLLKMKTLPTTGADFTITGKITSIFKPVRDKFVGNVVLSSLSNKKLDWFQKSEIQLISPIPLYPNQEISAKVRFKPIVGLLNEAGFDRETFLFSQGVLATAHVVDSASWSVLSFPSLRTELYQSITEQIHSSEVRALVLALAIGYKGAISSAQWQNLQATGLSHLIAISGLHIGIAFGLGFLIGRLGLLWSYRYYPLPFLLGMGCAFFYATLAGFSVSTERALIMCVLNALLCLFGAQISLTKRLLLTLVAVLVFDPVASLSVSFWLSFLAVMAIFYFIAHQTSSMVFWSSLLKLQCFLILVMTCASAFFFNGIAPLSFFYNLVFIPWFSFVVTPCVFLFSLLDVFFSSLSPWEWPFLPWLFFPFNQLISWSHGSWLPVSSASMMALFLCLSYLLLVLVVPMIIRVKLGIWFGLIYVSYWLAIDKQEAWQLDLLDLGHGLSVLIEKNGQVVLYDTGSAWDSSSMAERVLEPLLHQRNISRVDGMILSHFDKDHIGGLSYIQTHFSPRWTRSSQISSKGDVLACVAGEKWQWQGLSFEVLWPPKLVPRAYNPHSCVIKLSDPKANFSVLLTGDIDAVVEWLLLKHPESLSADLMLMPHHGSNTSSIGPFIKAVSPQYALASSAYNDRWQLPHKDVIARYLASGVKWFDTGEHGQISIMVQENRWTLRSARENSPWYRQVIRNSVE